MTEIEIFNPETMGPVLGPYSQIARVRARETIYISGQVGTDMNGQLAEGFEAQCAQTYANIEAALRSVGAGWKNVVQFTSYLINATDIPGYMSYRSKAYPIFFPDRVYPTHTLLIVSRLVKEGLLVEVTATAALP